jgi:hypothetical protein
MPKSGSGRKTKLTARVWTCVVCDEEVATYHDLEVHAQQNYHATLPCRIQPCNHLHLTNHRDYRNHLKTSHPSLYICSQCNTPFCTQVQLDYHASVFGHAPFLCDYQDCVKTFLRLDTYQRHQKVHQDDAKRFPCKHCKKYLGTNGFKRKDHLTQHLRGYHHIGESGNKKMRGVRSSCKHVDCREYTQGLRYNDPKHPFSSYSEFEKHLKIVHNTTDYPCPELNCDRVGEKGYMRKGDLRTHLKKVHDITDAIIEQVSLR